MKRPLVRAQEAANVGVRGLSILSIFMGLLLLLSLSSDIGQEKFFVTAKTHHSKRQASSAGGNIQTGRENTNWWNLWWQQYIDEAVQPTVRPIVAVSFDGRTISLSNQRNNDQLPSNLANDRDQRDLENNFLLSKNQPGAGQESAANQQNSLQFELERNERLKEIAASLPNNMHPSVAATHVMMAQRKSLQQQANWQMVRPTIFQAQSRVLSGQRDMRANRANMYQPNELENDSNMGIQMRAQMNKMQQQQVSNRFQSDFGQMPAEFEQQQQNQMVDYSEDGGEPNVEQENTIAGGGSDSSSMMMGSRPDFSPSRPQTSTERTINQETSTEMPEILSNELNNDVNRKMMTTRQREQLQPMSPSANEQSQPARMTTSRQQTSTTARPTSKSAPLTTSNQNLLDRQQTSTPSPTTSSSFRPPTTSSEVDVNETPISLEQDQPSTKKQPSSIITSVTPQPASARVELMNGRPATGMGQPRQQQQATTTSSRLPNIPSQMQTSPVISATTSLSGKSPKTTTTSTTTTTTVLPTTITSNQPDQTTTLSTRLDGTDSANQETGASGKLQTGRTTITDTFSPTSMTDEPTTISSTMGNTTDIDTDSRAEDDENDDDSSDQSGNEGNLSKTDSDSVEDNSSEDDNDEDQRETSTTTITPETSRAPEKATQQPPSLTTIEIERLPTSNKQQTPNQMGGAILQTTQTTRKQPAFVMMSLNPKEGEEPGSEGAIAVPMDALMKIMMNQMNQEDTNRLQSSTTQIPFASSKQVTSGRLVNQESQKTTTGSGTEDQRMRQSKQPPPPTTRVPPTTVAKQSTQITTTSTSTQSSATIGEDQTTRPAEVELLTTSTPKSINVGGIHELETDTRLPAKDDDNKIEMLNLDLMPIQRVMNNINKQQLQQQQQQQQPNRDDGGRKMRPSTEESLSKDGAPDSRDEKRMKMMEKLLTINVEPGMRLRPPTTTGQQDLLQQQMGARTLMPQPANMNQPNTVYMIMMNNGQQQPMILAPIATNATAHSKRPLQVTGQQSLMPSARLTTIPMATTTTTKQAPSTITGGSGTQQTSTSLVIGPMRVAGQWTTPAMTTASQQTMSMSVSSKSSTSTGTKLPKMTTVPVFTEITQASTSSPGDVNRNAADVPRRDNMIFRSLEPNKTTNSMQIMMMRQQQQSERPLSSSNGSQLTRTSLSSSEEPNQASALPETMTKAPVLSTSTSDGPRTTSKATPLADLSSASGPELTGENTTNRPADILPTTTAFSSSTGSSSTEVSTEMPTNTQGRTTMIKTTSAPITTAPIKQLEQQDRIMKPVSVSLSMQMQTTTPKSADNQKQQQFERVQATTSSPPTSPRGEAVVKRPQNKTGKVNKASNMTSSFIPAKLRMDFSKTSSKLQQQLSNGTSSNAFDQSNKPQDPVKSGIAQNMAIRQFGGANRMSVLANQPIPFGRPSAMTMQSQQLQQQTQRVPRIEVPAFEYGPSIAVRRPDEPLANGQMSNCTVSGKNFCVLTKDYPMNEVRQAVERSFRSVRIMYEELQTVSDQELHKEDFNATNNQAASGKFACQTQVEMMRPGWAKDEITKEWMLVVNTDVFPQRVRTESCAQPNTPCEFIAPFYDSTCQQRYSLHRMIAIDPHDPSRSPQVAVFKFPAGCVCRVHPIKKSITSSPTTAAM